uniref:CSON000982 protein n=1 Tax=Culicoides sonorensis TaxID=179676 RepID=A0A336K7X1_CULSO
MEREKLQALIGEEPSFCNKGRNSSLSTANKLLISSGVVGCTIDLSKKSVDFAGLPLEFHSDGGDSGDYVPTVGRWGSEWPSPGQGSVRFRNNGLTDPECHNDVTIKATALRNYASHVAAASAVTGKSNTTNKWITEDGYNLAAFEQTVGAWQIKHPLPLPKWKAESKKVLTVENIWQYEDMVALFELLLQRMIEETHYDTVHNFLEFYQSYKKSNTKSLRRFFKNYVPPVNRRHHMCVSLGMEIISRISEVYPEIAELFYLVSCEEAVEDVPSYIDNCEEERIEMAAFSLEKEHVLVAMKINVAGRDGILILDPGYHVARAVTIMKDQVYPHTGWFTQSDEPACKREYLYVFNPNSDSFIEWRERTLRAGKSKLETSLVFVERPYMTAIDVTVRRNLVYNFRSLLSRNGKGRVCAGIYFPIANNTTDAYLTIFYDTANGQSIKSKQLFTIFNDTSRIPGSVMQHLQCLAPQLRLELDELIALLKLAADCMSDFDFVKHLLHINDDIGEMSADN